MIRNIFFILLLVSFETLGQEIKKIRIDLDNAHGGTFSDYLKDIQYIPLETTSESLFGQIASLIVTDSSFVVTDNDTRSILFFSNTGLFLNKVSKIGSLNAVAAGYNSRKKSIDVQFLNYSGSNILINRYSLTGKLISNGDTFNSSNLDEINRTYIMLNSIGYDDNNYWTKNKIHNFDSSNTFFFFSQYRNNYKSRSAISFDSSGNYALYRIAKETITKLPPVDNTNFYFSTPVEHKVYKIPMHDGDPELLFQFVFPRKFGINNIPLNSHNKKQVDSAFSKKWHTEKTVLIIENILFDREKMLFKTNTGPRGLYSLGGNITARNFVYDFKNRKLVSFEKITPDSSTNFLPFSTPSTISFEGFYHKNSYLHTHISSLEMFAAYEANKSKIQQYPSELIHYFQTQNRKSNPVIARMKLKE